MIVRRRHLACTTLTRPIGSFIVRRVTGSGGDRLIALTVAVQAMITLLWSPSFAYAATTSSISSSTSTIIVSNSTSTSTDTSTAAFWERLTRRGKCRTDAFRKRLTRRKRRTDAFRMRLTRRRKCRQNIVERRVRRDRRRVRGATCRRRERVFGLGAVGGAVGGAVAASTVLRAILRLLGALALGAAAAATDDTSQVLAASLALRMMTLSLRLTLSFTVGRRGVALVPGGGGGVLRRTIGTRRRRRAELKCRERIRYLRELRAIAHRVASRGGTINIPIPILMRGEIYCKKQ